MSRSSRSAKVQLNVSPIHFGGAILEIVGDPATRLKGRYWTDRSSRGKFTFAEHSPEIAQSFEETAAMTFGVPRSVGVFDGLLLIIRTVTGKKSTARRPGSSGGSQTQCFARNRRNP